MPQLVADLVSHPSLSAILIHEHDDEMNSKGSIHINESHLHADARGTAAFIEEGLNHVQGQTSLCYWPWEGTVEKLLLDVKKVKDDNRF